MTDLTRSKKKKHINAEGDESNTLQSVRVRKQASRGPNRTINKYMRCATGECQEPRDIP